MVPTDVRNPESPATTAKNTKTSIAPATAPSSGRASSLPRMPTLRTRSSAGGVAVVKIFPLSEWGATVGPHQEALPDALLAQLDDLLGVLLRHERRSRQRLRGGDRAVLGVLGKVDDGQVALQVLLLVDGEDHVAVPDGL